MPTEHMDFWPWIAGDSQQDVNDALDVAGYAKPDFSGTALGRFDVTGGWQFHFPWPLKPRSKPSAVAMSGKHSPVGQG